MDFDLEELFALDLEGKLENQDTFNRDIAATIKQRRRQLLVHSYLYYRMNTNIITDSKYDEFAQELIQLQRDYPKESEAVEYYTEFKNFQMGDSFGLPMDEPWIHTRALQLVNYRK